MSSTPGTAAPAGKGAKERKGVGKVLYRMRSVFKKGESSKKASAGGAAAPDAPLMSTPAAAPAAAPQTKQPPHYEGASKIPRLQIHEERAKKLGTRFGIEIKPGEWHSTEGEVLRVDKTVRMRIHHECHRCHATFGPGKQCPTCQHSRCTKCTRYPPKRTEEEKQANRERREVIVQKHRDNAPIIPSYDYSQPILLKRPAKSGGQDLVFKGKPRMRVRRICHECNALIPSHGNKDRLCANCGHRRCHDCPRNPDARVKYPYGYPNDKPGPKFKGVYSCHECRKKFPPHAEDGTQCPSCDHKKCPLCPLVKPRKVEPEPEFNPDLLETVRLRMEALHTSDI
ncbi:hypothetical protein F4778DRAFT_334150 [Xylariomycetidae sp. FL2044]|nr:hypothetical protein F4778DRAFT_334150 [Xylariomycetidae sp. FL2044]